MSNNTITLEQLEQKINQIDIQINDCSKKIVSLKEQKEHLTYMSVNFQNIFGSIQSGNIQEQSLFTEITYDSSKSTSQLVIDILKKEARALSWQEIAEIFKKIKPEIKITGMRVALSKLKSNPNYHIKLFKEGSNFKYVYEK